MTWKHDPSIQSLLGAFGTVAAICLFLSPTSTFRRIWTNKDTELFSVVPYISTFLNCALWSIYGMPMITSNRFLLLLTNLAGFVIHSTFVIIFIANAKNEIRTKAIRLLGGSILILFFVIILLVFLPDSSRSKTVGVIAVVFNVLLYGSPLSCLGLVLKTQSIEFMPFYLSLGVFICSTTWFFYGLYLLDYYVMFPNLLGSILGIIQLAVYAYFSSKPKKNVEVEEPPVTSNQSPPVTSNQSPPVTSNQSPPVTSHQSPPVTSV